MAFMVYALYSEKYDKHYYGFTADFTARILSHNELGND
jgi:predicted GIY-YIG superfamily endonuclease